MAMITPSSWELWALAALAISIGELLDGSGHVLAVGLAAALMAAIAAIAAFAGYRVFPTWTVAMIVFGLLSVSSIVLARLIWKRRDDRPDINSY